MATKKSSKKKSYVSDETTIVYGVEMRKLKIKMSMDILNSIISFIYTPSILRTRKALSTTYRLFQMIDFSVYKNSDEQMARVKLIYYTLEGKFDYKLSGFTVLKEHVAERNSAEDNNPFINELLEDIPNDMVHLDIDDMKYLLEGIQDRVRYGYIVYFRDKLMEAIESIDLEGGDNHSYKRFVNVVYGLAADLINIKRKSDTTNQNDSFSLDSDSFANAVSDAVSHLQDKNRVFKTGIQLLNHMLAPGFQSKRLYCFLALPGGGKSQILLKSALDIKKYNPDIKARHPGKMPCVLLITMENDIDETIERIFAMRVTGNDIRNYSPEEVIKMLKEEGEMTLTDKNNIDIVIKYYPNRSIDTNDLRTIIQDEYDDGREVVTLILDYLKRIRPAEKADTEKEELKNITNELKTIAKELDIAVITAQQLNRNAASIVDAALQSNRSDVTRLVGRDGIAGAWEIQENCDVTIVVNMETRADTSDKYLTFKLLKRRYRSTETKKISKYNVSGSEIDYFTHPYDETGSHLIDDIYMPEPISKLSMTNSFDTPAPNTRNARPRPTITSKKAKQSEMSQLADGSEYEQFDPNHAEMPDF